MTLVPAKCPECGGNVVVDSEKDAWICDFCKTPFIVEKAINNFNTINNVTNNITNNNDIKADVVNVYESKNSDFVIKAGELIEYNGASMDVVIPDEVVRIKNGVFDQTGITSITFPDTISYIGSFYNCYQLKSIRIPNGITSLSGGDKWYDGMFAACYSLETVELPPTIERIDSNVFYECKNLKHINLPESLKEIGANAFEGCESLKHINVPSKVTNIQKKTFYRCTALEDVILPNGLTDIAEGAFKDCHNLKNIELPESLERIGSYDDAEWRGYASKDYEFGIGPFENCSSLNIVNIPSSISYVGDNAFKGCTKLTKAIISSKLIGHNAFNGCTNLAEVTILSVSRKRLDAFKGCNIKRFNGRLLPDNYNRELLLTKVTIDDTSGFNGGVFTINDWEAIGANPNDIVEITISDNARFPEDAGVFSDCKSLEILNISYDKLLQIGRNFKHTKTYEQYKSMCDVRNICHICGQRKTLRGRCKTTTHNEGWYKWF